MSSKRLILYHTNWACYGRSFQVKDLPIDYITDINYSFFDLREKGGFLVPTSSDPWADTDKRYGPGEGVAPADSDADGYFGQFGQFMKLKRQGKRFRFGLSIGGWTFSKHFSSSVRTPEARSAFVNEIIAILSRYPGLFDRIDFDWEYISPVGINFGDPGNETHPEDANNFSLLLQLLRQCLDSTNNSNIELSACVVGDPAKMDALPLGAMCQYLATINIMTYDFASSAWGSCLAGHQTNLKSTPYAPLSIERGVDFLIGKGVPPSKLIIGVAYYSRAFANTAGLGQPSSGSSPDKSWEDGVVDYKALPVAGATEYWDDLAKATYSYDPAKRVLSSYDSVESVRAKCAYVHEKGLAGIIVWESSADFPISHPRSLTAALHAGLIGASAGPVGATGGREANSTTGGLQSGNGHPQLAPWLSGGQQQQPQFQSSQKAPWL
ncbi:glycoside hydrolase [Rhizoclosmatium globosum]|uniref:Glycoside hydrolase n=1 Tax=Rhizoclosmatium globosum TaxID=329046 RepID=A0A1Y2BZM9_9FUNG|nr:glycoside hydrolase [Rhizoclosmatium globosum]|eukprot:ORY40253.1 glycoside hydrolase [Rhizoclosmatium globosum]